MTAQTTYRADPDTGVVLGANGSPVRHSNSAGYLFIQSNGKYVGLVHRIVWESVHGAIPPGLQINHKNGIKTDNRISNLEIATPKQNIRHAWITGLSKPHGAMGDRNGNAKLDSTKVRQIRALADNGICRVDIARTFGIKERTVYKIISRQSWPHVK